MNDTKIINVTIDGKVYGTYHCSEKTMNRALTMFTFMRKESDSDEDLKSDWDQVCSDHGLRFQKATNFDLRESVFNDQG